MGMIRHEVATGVRTGYPRGTRTPPDWFFHLPQELRAETEEAGMVCEAVLGVVGPAWLVPDLDGAWGDPAKRERILALARLTENEPVLGPRLLGVGRKSVC